MIFDDMDLNQDVVVKTTWPPNKGNSTEGDYSISFYLNRYFHVGHHIILTKTSCLTLPVRRYLVPTPSTKGGGGLSRPPYDLENGRL